MSIVESIIKCNKCNDEFTVTSEDYTACKCGASIVQPKGYSISYKREGLAGLNFELISSKTFFNENEFHKMSDRCQEKWNDIRELKFDDYSKNHFTYQHEEKSGCGRVFIKSLVGHFDIKVNTYESNRFRLNVDLNPNTNEQTIYTRLNRFYNLLLA